MNNINVIILGRSDTHELLGLFPVTVALVKSHDSNFVKPNLAEYWKYSVPIPLFNKHQDMDCFQEDNYILVVKPFLT
jgi:hypothetical protein